MRKLLWAKLAQIQTKKIGGENLTVEIDETRLTKRKINKEE